METLSDPWLRFAFEADRMDAPLYAALAQGVAEDADLRALAAHTRPHQPHPNLLFGSVHYLLLRGEADGDFRRYCRTLGGDQPVDAHAFTAFRDFCLVHREKLTPLIETRVTNTNEVGRSSLLHAGFRELAHESGEPLHLIEIGPSAGINMFGDRFSYRYHRDGEIFASGARHGGLTLECELRGLHLPSFGPSPRVGMRVGLERDPTDLSKTEDRDWLRALVWTDHPARLERLHRALAATTGLKPDIREGDALALLPDALAAAPAGGTLCVYHTIVTYQFSEEERDAVENILTVAGLRRPIWHLSLEGRSDLTFPLRLQRYTNGETTSRDLALCSPHGGWLDWVGK